MSALRFLLWLSLFGELCAPFSSVRAHDLATFEVKSCERLIVKEALTLIPWQDETFDLGWGLIRTGEAPPQSRNDLLGHIHWNVNGKHLYIEYYGVDYNHWGKGYSTILLRAVLRRERRVEQIGATLDDVNKLKYFENLDGDDEASSEAALRATPFYKSLSRFGFTEIVPGSIDITQLNMIRVTLTRCARAPCARPRRKNTASGIPKQF